MKFRFFCPVCKAAYLATGRDVGKKSGCKNCGQRLEVPPPSSRTRTVLGEVEPSNSEPITAEDEGRSRQTEPQPKQDTPRSMLPVAKFAGEPPPLPRRKGHHKKASFLGIPVLGLVIVSGSLIAVGALAVGSSVVFALHEKWHLENQAKEDIERRGIEVVDVTLHKSGAGYRGFARTYEGRSFEVTVVLERNGRRAFYYRNAPFIDSNELVTVTVEDPKAADGNLTNDEVGFDPDLAK